VLSPLLLPGVPTDVVGKFDREGHRLCLSLLFAYLRNGVETSLHIDSALLGDALSRLHGLTSV